MDTEESYKKIIELLSEIVKWVKFNGIQSVRQVLSENLKKDSDKIAYHYSDGRTSAEVAALAGVSDFTVRSYWKKWATLGLVLPSEKFKGRYERIFSLEDFGMEIPLPKKTETKVESKEEKESEQIGPKKSEE